MQYEYRVVPAPTKGQKAQGAKTQEQRFAAALAALLNQEAEEGWEYLRTETLPSTERQGLTGSKTVFQNLLVFRRPADPNAVAPEATTRDALKLLEDRSAEEVLEEADRAQSEEETLPKPDR
ncbi:MAG: DUF4177 domain-containing protein [Pseudomonadota bacterium]